MVLKTHLKWQSAFTNTLAIRYRTQELKKYQVNPAYKRKWTERQTCVTSRRTDGQNKLQDVFCECVLHLPQTDSTPPIAQIPTFTRPLSAYNWSPIILHVAKHVIRKSWLAECRPRSKVDMINSVFNLYNRMQCLTRNFGHVCSFNPLTAKLKKKKFHPFEVVSRWRDPQLQVSENYTDLKKMEVNCFQILLIDVIFYL